MGLKKKDLQRCFKEAKVTGAKFIAIQVFCIWQKFSDVTIMRTENLDNCEVFYNSKYGDDLANRNDAGERITGLCYGNTFNEIEAKLTVGGFVSDVQGNLVLSKEPNGFSDAEPQHDVTIFTTNKGPLETPIHI